jgi:hypothetical protein
MTAAVEYKLDRHGKACAGKPLLPFEGAAG